MEAQVDWGGARDGGVQSDRALLTWNVRGIVSIGLMCLPVCYLCPKGREPMGLCLNHVSGPYQLQLLGLAQALSLLATLPVLYGVGWGVGPILLKPASQERKEF